MKENRLVVGDVGWAETIPDWLLEEVKAERFFLGLGSLISDCEKVGDAEACVYLYTASLRQPLDHYQAEVYIYLTAKLGEINHPLLNAMRGLKKEIDKDARKFAEMEEVGQQRLEVFD